MDSYEDGGIEEPLPNVRVFNIAINLGTLTMNCRLVLDYDDDRLELRVQPQINDQELTILEFFTEEAHNDIFGMFREFLMFLDDLSRRQ